MFQKTVREFTEELSRFSPDARMSVVFSNKSECQSFHVDGVSPSTECNIYCAEDDGTKETITELQDDNDVLKGCMDSAADTLAQITKDFTAEEMMTYITKAINKLEE